jgi:hypothetical protein
VEKWIFTEAQLGKDDLDCHFSWIRRYFQYFVNIPGQNLTKPEHMFKALTHNTLHLDNTQVLWGNTKHAPLKRKFVLSKLKVQSVHEYVYVTKKKGLQEVKVSYHGGITSTNMQQSFTTKDAMYTTWLADTGFNPTDWVEKGTHSCRPEKIKKGKRSCEGTKRRKWKTLSSHVSEYKKTLIMFVKEWALDDYNTHRCIEDIAFRKSEYETTKTLFTGTTKGWAMKKSPPPVHIPHDVRLELVKLFNQKAPYVQPEEALSQIQAMEEFRNDVFVDHILTPAKIKAYFGRLLVIKKNGEFDVESGLPPEAAGGASKNKYKDICTKGALMLEIRKRNICTKGSLHRKNIAALVEILIENDAATETTGDNDMDEDEAHALVECASGGLDAAEGTSASLINKALGTELEALSDAHEDTRGEDGEDAVSGDNQGPMSDDDSD